MYDLLQKQQQKLEASIQFKSIAIILFNFGPALTSTFLLFASKASKLVNMLMSRDLLAVLLLK